MDTGSAYSILPFSSTAQTTGPALTAVSGASIKAWGRCRIQIFACGRHFIWRFLQAEVAFPIIGADFKANFKMAVDLSSMQLLCPAGLKILLEAPCAGSLIAAAIGVVDSPSTPSLLTVEALSSSPTLPAEEALGDSGPKGAVAGPHQVAKAAKEAKEADSVAQEVEQVMADYPSVVNASKKFPKAKHHVKHVIETTCPHPVKDHYHRLAGLGIRSFYHRSFAHLLILLKSNERL